MSLSIIHVFILVICTVKNRLTLSFGWKILFKRIYYVKTWIWSNNPFFLLKFYVSSLKLWYIQNHSKCKLFSFFICLNISLKYVRTMIIKDCQDHFLMSFVWHMKRKNNKVMPCYAHCFKPWKTLWLFNVNSWKHDLMNDWEIFLTNDMWCWRTRILTNYQINHDDTSKKGKQIS